MKRLINLKQLKYSIWMYYIIYTLVIVVVFWVLQIVFLDSFYQRLRYNNLVKSGNEIASEMNVSEVDSTLIEEWVNSYIEANEMGIYSYFVYHENDQLVVESPYSKFIASDVKPETNGPKGVKNSSIFADAEAALLENANSNDKYICDYFLGNDNKTQFCVYATKVSNPIGDFTLVMISSNQEVSEVLSLVQYQLLVVIVLALILSFFLALVVAGKISRPIQNMADTARRLAEGNAEVVFKGNSYEELNELAEAMNFTKEGLVKANSLQRDLLANVSHDLKTPLTMIKAYAEMIRDISGENKQKRDLHTNVIIEEADRLAMLVNDILNLSKLQNNTEIMEYTAVNLSELTERVIYRFQNFMAEKGYHIESYIDDDLFTLCDEQKIEQVIYNLIGNSLNYTGRDKTVKVHLHKKDNGILLLEIFDSGKGISPEQISEIWERYYRFADTHQRPVKGTGLGLSIVKTILQNHRLKFGVISKKGIGSNFFVEFKEMNDD